MHSYVNSVSKSVYRDSNVLFLGVLSNIIVTGSLHLLGVWRKTRVTAVTGRQVPNGCDIHFDVKATSFKGHWYKGDTRCVTYHTGDLPSLVTRCDHSNYPFSYNLFSYTQW